FLRPLHEAGEVVGHGLGGDGAVHALYDQIRGLDPAEGAGHHLAREDDAAGGHPVEGGGLGGRAVGGLAGGGAGGGGGCAAVAGDVVDVAAGGDADAADLRREGVGEVVAVEVERGDDVELVRTGEHLLEGDVGDGVLHQDLAGGEGGLLLGVGLALALGGLGA